MKLKIKVTPTENEREWELLETIWYHGVKVPSGFVFDGASIPLGLRWLFPHGGRKFFAACIHDYCYRTGCVPRDEADQLFLEAMLENEVQTWKAKAMFGSVKTIGWMFYREQKEEKDV